MLKRPQVLRSPLAHEALCRTTPEMAGGPGFLPGHRYHSTLRGRTQKGGKAFREVPLEGILQSCLAVRAFTINEALEFH